MNTITIRLPDMEATMLVEAQQRNEAFRDISKFVSFVIREKNLKLTLGRGS